MMRDTSRLSAALTLALGLIAAPAVAYAQAQGGIDRPETSGTGLSGAGSIVQDTVNPTAPATTNPTSPATSTITQPPVAGTTNGVTGTTPTTAVPGATQTTTRPAYSPGYETPSQANQGQSVVPAQPNQNMAPTTNAPGYTNQGWTSSNNAQPAQSRTSRYVQPGQTNRAPVYASPQSNQTYSSRYVMPSQAGQNQAYNNRGQTYNYAQPAQGGQTYNYAQPNQGQTYNYAQPAQGQTYYYTQPYQGQTYYYTQPYQGQTYYTQPSGMNMASPRRGLFGGRRGFGGRSQGFAPVSPYGNSYGAAPGMSYYMPGQY